VWELLSDPEAADAGLVVRAASGGVVDRLAVRADEDASEWRPGSVPAAVVRLERLRPAGVWRFALSAAEPFSDDVRIEVPLRLPALPATHSLWPMFEGLFGRCAARHAMHGHFRGPGFRGAPASSHRLSLPFLALQGPAAQLVVGADPDFELELEWRQGEFAVLRWTYDRRAGRHDESRQLFALETPRGCEQALDAWFAAALPGRDPAPTWLHQIALQDFDFLSKDGRGWFADVEAATAFIDKEDRSRALFALHGWYDRIGRYCFDAERRQLDKRWTAMPHMGKGFPAEVDLFDPDDILDPPASYRFRNVDRYRPVEMSWDEVRARLGYARNAGFRTATYLLCGLMDAGELAASVADGTGLPQDTRLWTGPDHIGPSYLRNPLHPDVRSWALSYTEALLDRIGDLTDALVMDESYFVGYDFIGPPSRPGYAAAAQASLIRELTQLCHRYREDLAFLTADQLGTHSFAHLAYPYALYADGIYHDAWCTPQSHAASRFPTWRRVVWSCNWAPRTNRRQMAWAVRAFGAPIAVSNGVWGDDCGLADMPPDVLGEIEELWEYRRALRRGPTVAITDLEPGAPQSTE
jgi:hypothetical protein